jgi:hypothetical protein
MKCDLGALAGSSRSMPVGHDQGRSFSTDALGTPRRGSVTISRQNLPRPTGNLRDGINFATCPETATRSAQPLRTDVHLWFGSGLLLRRSPRSPANSESRPLSFCASEIAEGRRPPLEGHATLSPANRWAADVGPSRQRSSTSRCGGRADKTSVGWWPRRMSARQLPLPVPAPSELSLSGNGPG